MSTDAEWIASLTVEQVTTGMSSAIKAHDWPAVVALLKILAIKDPARAQAIYDVLTIATSEVTA